jgi:hypothetical protein
MSPRRSTPQATWEVVVRRLANPQDSAALRLTQLVQNLLAKHEIPQCNNLHILPTLYRETFLTFQDKTPSEKQNIERYEDH